MATDTQIFPTSAFGWLVLVAAVILAVALLGLFVKALLWIAAIAAVIFIVGAVTGRLRRSST